MAKKQTFEDKSKKGAKALMTVKFVKTIKSDKGSYKFNEKFVRIEDISKVTTLK